MSVEQNLQAIMNARYGRDVRQSIHDAIEDINEVAVSAQGIASTSSENARAYALMAREHEQQARALRDEAETFSENAFSTTPEGYETVAQKVSGLELSVETGNKFNKAGTAKGNCLINKVYGMSVQEGVPSPSIPLDIKDFNLTLYNTGKNLIYFPYTNHPESHFPFTYTLNGITYNFQQDGSIILNGTTTDKESAVNINTPYTWDIANELVAGRTYYITDGREGENARHPNGYVQFVLVSEDDERIWVEGSVNNKGTTIATFTNTGQVDEKFNRWGARVCVSVGQTCNNVVVKPMVSFSDDLTYVKGRPNEKIETSIVLRALEVEANDTYNFVKNGNYYIADTLEENENGYEIIRRVGHKVFDGSENWKTVNVEGEVGDIKRKYLIDNQIPSYAQLGTSLTATNKKGYVTSSAYPEAMTNGHTHPYKMDETIALHDTNHWIQVYDERYNSNNDLAEWKAHLAEEPLVVNYRLYKTEIEPISTTDAQILYNLISDDGNTILELVSDIDTDMEVMIPTTVTTATVLKGYNRAKLNSIKLDEMRTALLELGGIE